jgi:uridylate kinase
MQKPYQRVLLKLSGEALGGAQDDSGGGHGIDPESVRTIAKQVVGVARSGVQVAIVVGGGNILRGADFSKLGGQRASADYMGMLATVINALALCDALESQGLPTRVMTAIEIRQVAEPFLRRVALAHLEKGRVVILAAGTGNPFFTTDTAAALRAVEIGAEILLMAKNHVDGVYDKDPRKHPDARRYVSLTFTDALRQDLRVMDATAFALCRENEMSIIVFDMNVRGNIQRVVAGEPVGTVVVKDSEQTRFAS